MRGDTQDGALRAPSPDSDAKGRVTVRGTDRGSARHVRRYATIAAAAAISLLAAACGGHAQSPSPGQAKAQASASARAHAAMLAAELKITPSNGSRDVDPGHGIGVTAATGKVTNVTVRSSGDAVSGRLSDGGKTWLCACTLA